MIRVHHLELSRSHRVLWLLEELGGDYEIVHYKRNPKTFRADPGLKALHPLGKAPIVEIEGHVLVESGAILEGVLDRVANDLRPEPGSEAHAHYRMFLHYAEGSVMPPLLVSLILGRMKSGVPGIIRPIIRKVVDTVNAKFTHGEFETHFGFIEQHLQANTWFAGDAFSAADIQMVYPMEAGPLRAGITAESHPAVFRWIEAARARPAYQAALDKGGPLFP